jgi:hypothetical protein
LAGPTVSSNELGHQLNCIDSINESGIDKNEKSRFMAQSVFLKNTAAHHVPAEEGHSPTIAILFAHHLTGNKQKSPGT